MADYDLDDIRLKEPGELEDEEKSFLREHKDDLTDEDRETFGEILSEEEKEEDEGGKGFAFESEEDFVEKTSRVFEKVLEKREKKPEPEPADKGDERIFPEDFKPKDWEEAGQHIFKYWDKKQQAQRAELQRKADEINKEWDNQLADIRMKNSDLPKAGTKEGAKFDQELSGIIAKYKGVTNMDEAYEIYEATHKKPEKKEVGDKQKNLAQKVAAGSSGDANQGERKYEEVAKRSIDDARDAAIKRFEELS